MEVTKEELSEDAEKRRNQEELEQLPVPPKGSKFCLRKIEKICIPHPYCITPRHLLPHRRYLDENSIREAEEKHGAVCDTCKHLNRKHGKPILSYDEHKTSRTLFIQVDQNEDLNSIKGLHAYLMLLKPKLEAFKIDGIVFPTQ